MVRGCLTLNHVRPGGKSGTLNAPAGLAYANGGGPPTGPAAATLLGRAQETRKATAAPVSAMSASSRPARVVGDCKIIASFSPIAYQNIEGSCIHDKIPGAPVPFTVYAAALEESHQPPITWEQNGPRRGAGRDAGAR